MKKATFLLCFAMTFFFSFGQQAKIDSLKNELKTEQKKEERLELLYQLCNMVLTTDVSDEHQEELKEQVNLAKELKNYTYLTSAYQNFSTYHALRAERDLAIEKIKTARYLADSLKDYLSLQQCIMQEATLLDEKGETKKAEALLFEGLHTIENNNLSATLSKSFRFICRHTSFHFFYSGLSIVF